MLAIVILKERDKRVGGFMENQQKELRHVKAISLETFITLAVIVGLFTYLGSVMGIDKVFSVMMKTGFDVLINTSFYIMAVAILAGAVAAILSEFGVIALINKIISPVMRPLFGLPGAAALGATVTYISDNPAILSLAEDEGFSKYFTKAEKATFTNLGKIGRASCRERVSSPV